MAWKPAAQVQYYQKLWHSCLYGIPIFAAVSISGKELIPVSEFHVTAVFDKLTRPEQVKVLILDDSVIKRNQSKTVELLIRVYDHVEHKFQKGFTLLALGWSDGYNFIPVAFDMLYMFCDDIQDMDLTNALQSLTALFANITANITAEIKNMIKSKVSGWMSTQALFIQTLFGELCRESCIYYYPCTNPTYCIFSGRQNFRLISNVINGIF